MTRWLITGAGGQLGRDLQEALSGQDVLALTRADLDLRDETPVRTAVRDWVGPGAGDAVVVNTAAYTGVDAAETDEHTAAIVNGLAPGWIASAVGTRARLIHVSTDYVFAGDSTTPYEIDDPTEPRTAYGRTKLAGERAVLTSGADARVVRTSWLYGAHGTNFVRTMIGRERERGTVDVVDDQRGSPTWSAQLAEVLVELGGSAAPPGTYHCSGAGDTTWCGLARAVFEELGADPARVRPVGTTAASRRPRYSVLSHASWERAGLAPMPPWRSALHEAMSMF